MEFEQLIKRIDWLEKQQRKDQESTTALAGRMDSIETSLEALSKQVKTLSKTVSEFHPIAARINQFEEIFAKQRKEMSTALEEIEKKVNKRDLEAAKQRQAEIEKIHTSIAEVRQLTDTSDIRKQLKLNAAEDIRISQAVADIKTRAEEIAATHDQLLRAQKAADEARRTDLKRVADAAGDIAALRKRLDETRDKMQLNIDSLRNAENRVNELLASETERKQAQTIFIEQQSIAQVERERSWKEWNSRVDEFKKQAASLDIQLQAAEDVTRAAKRAQDSYVELNQKLERRVNEVSEMQRLAEERARQEWIAFKAEDQKRWTSYTLSQDETGRELRASLQSTLARIVVLEEPIQTLQDQLHQTTDATEHQLQELMNWAHEWLTSSERIMGHGKKPTKKTK
jgi:myosin heavy subunit